MAVYLERVVERVGPSMLIFLRHHLYRSQISLSRTKFRIELCLSLRQSSLHQCLRRLFRLVLRWAVTPLRGVAPSLAVLPVRSSPVAVPVPSAAPLEG